MVFEIKSVIRILSIVRNIYKSEKKARAFRIDRRYTFIKYTIIITVSIRFFNGRSSWLHDLTRHKKWAFLQT